MRLVLACALAPLALTLSFAAPAFAECAGHKSTVSIEAPEAPETTTADAGSGTTTTAPIVTQ